MSLILVRDNENNRWKRNSKTNKQTNKNRKEQSVDASCSERMRAK